MTLHLYPNALIHGGARRQGAEVALQEGAISWPASPLLLLLSASFSSADA